jgi:hypothetical protein
MEERTNSLAKELVMNHRKRLTSILVASAVAVASLSISATHASAQCPDGNCGGAVDSFSVMGGNGYYSNVQPLFNNYFTQGHANSANAAMYMSPIGVPGNVGHTYNTYQPFYPHQYLYAHRDRYHSYYSNGDGTSGLNRTSAHYYSPPVRTVAKRFYKMIEIPR